MPRKPRDVESPDSFILDHLLAVSAGSVPLGFRGQAPGLFGQWTVLLATIALWVPGPPPSTHVQGEPSESGLVHAVLRIVDLVLQDNSVQIQVTRAISLGF